MQAAAEARVLGLERGHGKRHGDRIPGRIGDRERRPGGAVEPAERQRREEAAPRRAIALHRLGRRAGDADERTAARPPDGHADRADARARRDAQAGSGGGVDAHVQDRRGGARGEAEQRRQRSRGQDQASSHPQGYDTGACVPPRTIRPMQRAVAIALAGGLLAASAGAFGLAQVLKLERSPIEAIRVDPTPNHDRGRLDRHDSALFSPRCSAPCLPAAVVRFRVHTSGPVRAEGRGTGRAGRAGPRRPAAPGRADRGALERPRCGRNGRSRRLLPDEGQPFRPQDRAAQPARRSTRACACSGRTCRAA